MLRFGICTRDQYRRSGKQRRLSGSRVAFHLLAVGDNPSREDIEIFEDINFTLRTSNGTCRTTFRNRLTDVDAATIKILEQLYPRNSNLLIEDRAVSHGLTSIEFAQQLFSVFSNACFEASDRLLHLVQLTLPSGEHYIVEPDGKPIQYINPPFVVSLAQRESRFLPVNQLIAAWAKHRLRDLPLSPAVLDSLSETRYRISTISCIHPEVVAFQKSNPRFQMRTRSVFDVTAGGVHLLRTMNILNKDYFSDAQLRDGVDAAFRSLKEGGVWIVGRTLERDFSNHVSFLQKSEDCWQLLGRIGNGSEMEHFVGTTHPSSEVLLQQ